MQQSKGKLHQALQFRILSAFWILVASGSHAFTPTLKFKSELPLSQHPNALLPASRIGYQQLSASPSISSDSLKTVTNIVSKFTKNDSNSNNNNKVQKYLVDALDLYPLLENVARFTGTKRGRDALMYLVSHDESRYDNKGEFLATRNYESSKRKAMLSSMTASSSSSSSFSANVDRNGRLSVRRNSSRHIMKIADDASEAREEWARVQEAMNILQSQERENQPHQRRSNVQSTSMSQLKMCIPLPPIYAADSSTPYASAAIGGDGTIDTDDDEWLQQILAGFGGKLELEHILQADQIVNRILSTFAWANSSDGHQKDFSKFAPNLCTLFDSSGMDIEALKQLHSEIDNTVKIEKGSANPTMTGMNSYIFQMNEEKFPSLSILRRKERNLVRKMNEIVQGLLENKKYLSQLSGFSRKKPEPYELDGRVVVAASKEVANRIGVIRGHSSTGSFCFVEPREVISIGNELKSIREEISSVVNEISEHLSSIIIRSATTIDRGLDIVARIDTIFARAAFGCTLNGFVPYVGTEGVIDVPEFIHPVLASSGTGRKTVPIDLKLGHENGDRALIISGPNGKTRQQQLPCRIILSFLRSSQFLPLFKVGGKVLP